MSTTSTRQFAVQTSREIVEALNALLDGVVVEQNRVTYDSDGFNINLRVSRVREDGSVMTPEARDFQQFAGLEGMDAEWLHQTFTHNGVEYRITGYRTRARKQPVIAERVSDGKSFVFPTIAIKRAMEVAR